MEKGESLQLGKRRHHHVGTLLLHLHQFLEFVGHPAVAEHVVPFRIVRQQFLQVVNRRCIHVEFKHIGTQLLKTRYEIVINSM